MLHIRKIYDSRTVVTVIVTDLNISFLHLPFHPNKLFVLLQCIGLIPFIRLGKMGKHAFHTYIRQMADPLHRICALFVYRETDPSHSGVDLNVKIHSLPLSECLL